nr:uncharacterized protein LOC112939553 [Oryza sativa Japonica Group]
MARLLYPHSRRAYRSALATQAPQSEYSGAADELAPQKADVEIWSGRSPTRTSTPEEEEEDPFATMAGSVAATRRRLASYELLGANRPCTIPHMWNGGRWPPPPSSRTAAAASGGATRARTRRRIAARVIAGEEIIQPE